MVGQQTFIDIPRQEDFSRFFLSVFVSFIPLLHVVIIYHCVCIGLLCRTFLVTDGKLKILFFILTKYTVSPGAKERLVQITGPNEEKIK